jgi:hypothetical protein
MLTTPYVPGSGGRSKRNQNGPTNPLPPDPKPIEPLIYALEDHDYVRNVEFDRVPPMEDSDEARLDYHYVLYTFAEIDDVSITAKTGFDRSKIECAKNHGVDDIYHEIIRSIERRFEKYKNGDDECA